MCEKYVNHLAFIPERSFLETSEGKGRKYRRARGRSAAPARAEWARAQSARRKGSSRGPSAQPGGKPSSRAAHGCSPTARGRGGSNVVKQVIQEGKEGAAVVSI